MQRLTDLKFLFAAVAILEFFYFAAAMMPPSIIPILTGWNLSADGHWIVKITGLSLGTMGYIAWIFRHDPHIGVAKGLAFYQMASATADWVMWIALSKQGVFENALAQSTVVAAIVSHYFFGVCLILAIRKNGARA